MLLCEVVPSAKLACDLLLDRPQYCIHIEQTMVWVLAPGACGGRSPSPWKVGDMQVP